MNLRRLLYAGFSLLLFGTQASFAETNSVSTKGPYPAQLELFWAGLPGLNFCSVKWDGKSLTYEQRFKAKKQRVEITPTAEQWTRFWAKMDEVGVWCWQKRYDNPPVMDGAVWNLKMEHGTNKVRCSGSNAYPGDKGANVPSISPTQMFLKYQEAVEALIGRKLWAQ